MAAIGSSSSIFPSFVWDYTFQEICSVETDLKQLKMSEGKESPRYIDLKEKATQLRMAHLPFRSYVRWKEKNPWMTRAPFFSTEPRSKAALLQGAISPLVQARLKLLSQLTFIHGSNSSTLVLMHLTQNYRLQCTGMLLSHGIAPMCGELSNGSSLLSNGVNAHYVSVDTVRNTAKIQGYAEGKGFSAGAAKSCHFNPSQLMNLCYPLLKKVPTNLFSLNQLRASLRGWKREDEKDFHEVLSPGGQTALRWITAIEYTLQTFSMEEEVVIYLKKLKAYLVGTEEFPEDTDSNANSFWKDCKEGIVNPYAFYSNAYYWSNHALELLQMKQWDHTLFENHVLPHRSEWLQCIDNERLKHEVPLRQLIALIDHEILDEERAFLKKALWWDPNWKEIEIPLSLQELFPSVSSIPNSYELGNGLADLDRIHGTLPYYLMGSYSWAGLIRTVLKAKLESEALEWETLRKEFEEKLGLLQSVYQLITSALMDDTSQRVQIPFDESIRGLITHPIPIIFASTTVRPKPYKNEPNPSEYVLDTPVSLGKEGCNILFTDNEVSKARLEAILPPHLQKEVEIHLFEELNVGPIPLIHAESQIERYTAIG